MPKAERARQKFICPEGYPYRFDRFSKKEEGLKFWRCVERGNTCKARVHVNAAGAVVRWINLHTHAIPAPKEGRCDGLNEGKLNFIDFQLLFPVNNHRFRQGDQMTNLKKYYTNFWHSHSLEGKYTYGCSKSHTTPYYFLSFLTKQAKFFSSRDKKYC